MNNLPNLLTISLAVLIGAFASTSLAALTLIGKPTEQPPLNYAYTPDKALVLDATGNWLRVSQETRQGLYLSLPTKRWIF